MRITKKVTFSASHYIPEAGKCSNLHGHNWTAIIEVDTPSKYLDKRGFIADVRDLKNAAFKYDHGHLNDHFDIPSTELVAKKIAEDAVQVVRTSNPITQCEIIVKVTLIETENNSAVAWSYG